MLANVAIKVIFNRWLAVGVLVLMLTAACGGDGDTASVTEQGTSPTATTAASTTDSTTESTTESSTTETSTTDTSTTETSTSSTTTDATSSEKATLQIGATDAPPEGVTMILITVSDIEVQTGGPDPWQTIVEGPIDFDLVQIQGIEQTLGEAELEPGRYGQIRLNIDKAEVTVEGNTVDARVPGDKLRIVGGFDLVAGETTILTLDFDAEKSVVIAGTRNVIIKPAVKLLRREGGEDLSSAEEIGENEEEDAEVVEEVEESEDEDGGEAAEALVVEVTNQDPGGSGQYQFDPSEFTFNVGDTVTFQVSAETEFHTFDVDELDIHQELEAGQTVAFTVIFEQAGTFKLFCVPHEALGMTGTITVN